MKKLNQKYWDMFIDVDNKGIARGNGEEFETLVDFLLTAIYGKKWVRTKRSHDDNRDFWMFSEEEHVWAECKNYKTPIAMSTLAPTLVMAQVYAINEIIFFSRSYINPSAKNKIMAFGEKSNKTIIFYDGQILENLIWDCRKSIPKKYSPKKYFETADPKPICVDMYFLRNAISNVHIVAEAFEDYTNADTIYYNETFALTFYLTNPFQENSVEVEIEFLEDSEDRFCFEYFYPTIVPEEKQWYKKYLKKGEGRAVSLNMRQIHYKREIHLPRFRIRFSCQDKEEHLEWISEDVCVNCNWVGKTQLIGSGYLDIIQRAEDQLVNNPQLSSLILVGSSGTGKSRMLQECQNVFLKNGYQIINFSEQKDFSSHYFLKEIVSFLYEIPEAEVLELLEKRLLSVNLEPKFVKLTEAEKAIRLLKKIIACKTEKALEDILEKYADILYAKLSKNKVVLIIDNVQYAGSAFQKFLENYIYYSVNQQSPNYSVLLLVFNLDYMTSASSEMLYNLQHSNICHLISRQITGFKEKNQGIMFLQELTRSHEDENNDFFSEIIKKVSLKPYNLFQTVKYLEEIDAIRVTPERKGYILSTLDRYNVLSSIANGIDDILLKRFEFSSKLIPLDRILFICSVMYIFDSIDSDNMKIFQISTKELNCLCKQSILKLKYPGCYVFDHDIIRAFFNTEYSSSIMKCFEWLEDNENAQAIRRYQTAYQLFEIVISKDTKKIVELGSQLEQLDIPERLASFFYSQLLDAFTDMLIAGEYQGIYIKYIHRICAYIRQYDGSEKAWDVAKHQYDVIQEFYPNALAQDIFYYRPFIHFCCDIAVELHLYDEEISLIKNVLGACEKIKSMQEENQDELYVLKAIMYNRWYISYNTESFKNEVQNIREHLMKESRSYIPKIQNATKRGLIEYLNNSDEGYNFYGYEKDKEKLFSIWGLCIIDIPMLVPEKTLNYYRKTVQYGLINQDGKKVAEEIKKAMEYLEVGEYSHEPVIFRTFFLMAEVMSNIQGSPLKTYYYNVSIINTILELQQLLNNHKIGDILLLKGVNAYYAQNRDEVYYSFKEAYRHYANKETSRYWIKKTLLEENISYAFTQLGIYNMGYDVSCFPPKCRQPIVLTKEGTYRASGIQRTGDQCLNLPLI